jgi:hypothetical protein
VHASCRSYEDLDMSGQLLNLLSDFHDEMTKYVDF